MNSRCVILSIYYLSQLILGTGLENPSKREEYIFKKPIKKQNKKQ